MRAIELFPCSGGMAEGFRRAGIEFELAFDKNPDACSSYELNLGKRPIEMDVRDLLRLARAGWTPGPIDLFVADPPCTPWSRSGKRKGLDDERDMLAETCELIAVLRPSVWVIGNVPGLDDSTNVDAVRKTIGELARSKLWCVDYARLDACDYGVPQHRVRPFWIGHPPAWPHMQWPARTHAEAEEASRTVLFGEPLKPWVTCKQVLGDLELDKIGKPVRVQPRNDAGDVRHHSTDKPARTVTGAKRGSDTMLMNDKHPINRPDAPSFTVTTKGDGRGAQGACVMEWPWDAPATTVTTDGRIPPPGHHPEAGLILSAPEARKKGRWPKQPQSQRVSNADEPMVTIDARASRKGNGSSSTISWPWEEPSTTVCTIPKIAAPNEHEGHKGPNAVVLSELAAKRLQGFPDAWHFVGKTKRSRWSQLGQAMPPALAHAVATSVRELIERGMKLERRIDGRE